MPKCKFNKVVLLSCKFAAYFQNMKIFSVIWVELILFFSVTDSFLSLKVLKFQNCIISALRDQEFLQFVPRACFEKPRKNIRKLYQTSVPAIQNFFFCFDDVTNTRETSINKVQTTSTFFAKRKNSCEMEILSYMHVQKIVFAKKILGGNVIQCNVFISENER